VRTLNRYILKEHTGPFVFALLTIVFVFLLNTVFRDLGKLLSKGVPAGVILQFFVFNLAWIVALAVPMAVLVSTLMAFGRLSADHELTALKASGVHFYRLVLPVVVASLILAVGMERFNNLVLPEVNHQYRKLSSDISKKKPTVALEAQVFNDIDEKTSLLAETIDEKRNMLYHVVIYDYSDAASSTTILADSCHVFYDEVAERMELNLFHGEMHQSNHHDYNAYRRGDFERLTQYIQLENQTLKRRERNRRGIREKSVSMMRDDVKGKHRAITEQGERIHLMAVADWKSLLPLAVWDATGDSLIGVAGGGKALSRARRMKLDVGRNYSLIKNHRKRISALRVEIHKKYAIPLACLVFVLIGAPLGFMARQGGLAVGGGLSLVFFLIYWVFLIGGESLADRMVLHPVLAMWLPNAVVGAAGVYLMVRTVRESAFIRWEGLTNLLKRLKTRHA